MLTIYSRNHPVTFDVVQETDQYLLIRDRNEGRSVTNSAEDVVLGLIHMDRLPLGKRLFYYDTTGRLDEIVRRQDDGRFSRFAPCLERDLHKVCNGGVGK